MNETRKPVIQDTIDYFPSSNLNNKEKLLIVAQILRYTSTDLANTLPPEIRLETKLADSNLIERLITKCPDHLVKGLFLNIGANIRMHLTRNKELIGLEEPKIITNISNKLN